MAGYIPMLALEDRAENLSLMALCMTGAHGWDEKFLTLVNMLNGTKDEEIRKTTAFHWAA